MKVVKALIVLIIAIAFIGGASLLRPRIEQALGKKPSEKEKGKKPKQEFKLGFGYEQLVPTVEISTPSRKDLSETVQAPGSVAAGSEVSVGAPLAGVVLGLAVDEGDTVKKGDLVFALDPRDQKEALAECELALKTKTTALAEARLEQKESKAKLADRTKKEEASAVREARLALKKSQISLDQAKARLETAESNAKRARLLAEKGLGTTVEVESAEAELRVSRLQLKLAEKDLQLARDTLALRLETAAVELRDLRKAVELAALRVKQAINDKDLAELNLSKAKFQLEQTRIHSPISGLVTMRNINSGENVNRNDSSSASTSHYIISDFSRLFVYSDVDESDIVKVDKGQSVTVRVNALGDEIELPGKVYEIGNRAAQDGDTLFFRVKVLLDTPHKSLRPGMTANVEIETKRAENALTVPVQAVGQRRRRDIPKELLVDRPEGKSSETFDVVLVAVEGKARMKIIETGISDGDRVEITAGLEPGDQLISGPYRALETLQHGDPVRIDLNAGRGRRGKGKGGRDKDSKGKDSQGKDSQAKDSQGKDSQGKDSKRKDSQGKDSQGKDSKGKDSQGKDSKAKDSRGGERAEVKDSESAKASAGAGTDSGKGS